MATLQDVLAKILDDVKHIWEDAKGFSVDVKSPDPLSFILKFSIPDETFVYSTRQYIIDFENDIFVAALPPPVIIVASMKAIGTEIDFSKVNKVNNYFAGMAYKVVEGKYRLDYTKILQHGQTKDPLGSLLESGAFK